MHGSPSDRQWRPLCGNYSCTPSLSPQVDTTRAACLPHQPCTKQTTFNSQRINCSLCMVCLAL
jgi:hypothetical protein